MLTYNQFKRVISDGIVDYLPEKYRESNISVNRVERANFSYDALNIFPKSRGNDFITVSPNINLEILYQKYLQCDNIETALKTAVRILETNPPVPESFDLLKTILHEKEKIVIFVLNHSRNANYIASMPNRRFLDLVIVCKWLCIQADGNCAAVPITYSLLNKLNMTEEQLMETAIENTRKIFPVTFLNFKEALGLEKGWIQEDAPFYIVSNPRSFNGSSAFVFEDYFFKLAQTLSSDLYILPSSVHELIALSAEYGNAEDLRKIVSTVNAEVVAPEDWLSDNVYYYSLESRKITIAD